MKGSRILALCMAAVMAFSLLGALGGCGRAPRQKDSNLLRIALLGYKGSSIINGLYRQGIEMAIAEYEGPYTIELVTDESTETDEDAINTATKFAADPDVSAIVCLYQAYLLDVLLQVASDNQKTFVAVDGYSLENLSTIDYFIPFSLSGALLGVAMQKYVDLDGGRFTGCYYNGNDLDLEIAVNCDDYVVSSLREPASNNDFYQTVEVWNAMDVDHVFVIHQYDTTAMSYIQIARGQTDNITYMLYLNNLSDGFFQHLDWAEGTVMPSLYPSGTGEAVRDWQSRYQQRTGEAAGDRQLQAYDLVNALAQVYTGDNTTLGTDFWGNMQQVQVVAQPTFDLLFPQLIPFRLPSDPLLRYTDARNFEYSYNVIENGVLRPL